MSWRPSAQKKRELRARFDNDRSRAFARRAVDAVIAAEVASQRPLDWKRTPLQGVPEASVTAVIKTFERPREVRRLVKSIRRTHPDLPIIVVDDSRDPRLVKGAELLAMPFNSGISVGRNAALERVATPYFLLLDDDFVFYRHTRVADSVAIIGAHPEIDILGGQVVNLPDFTAHDYSWVTMQLRDVAPEFPPGSYVGGLPVYSKVPNFFIGRTEAVKAIGWRDELKVMEHQEFFTRAFGVLTTVYDERLRVLHAKNPFDRTSPERLENRMQAGAVLARLRNEAALRGD